MITYTVEKYTGRQVCGTFLVRVGVQIVATEDDRRAHVFRTGRGRSPCLKYPVGTSHYRSGMNSTTRATLEQRMAEAVSVCALLNRLEADAMRAAGLL